MPKLHIASSRPVGERVIAWAKERYELYSMEECDIFFSVMYENLIDERFIASKKKCFNIHPGILPGYRGAGSYSWAIINGEDFAGITLHEIDVSIDHGPIIEVTQFPIEEKDTAGTLFTKAEEAIYEMFIRWLPKLMAGDYSAIQQNEKHARIYYRKDLQAVKDITKIIRAFTFPGKESAFYYDRNGEKKYVSW